ncbi:MAG: asparagine synthase-related protein [Novosphingobium sp.]
MIGLTRIWTASSWVDRTRFAPSLGLFAGAPSNHEYSDTTALFRLDAPRARPSRGWRAQRSPGGLPVLLNGWIDNRAELARSLGLDPDAPASQSFEYLYGCAFERWGDQADARISGLYAAIIPLSDGRVRLARSPLGAYPLFYAADSHGVAVCSIPRPIFAAGWPKALRAEALVANLAFQLQMDKEASQYEGLRQVPEGSIAYISPEGVTCRRWYDLTALPKVRYRRDEDYVDHANALLAESVGHALAQARNPAMSLSGGLDSAICTDEILRQLPAGQRLKTYTFHPLNEWSGEVPPTNFADERDYVRDFIAMHPQIDPIFIENRDAGYDHKAEQFFLAMSTAYPSMTVGVPHHGVWQAAADSGVDWLLTAADGNQTISDGAGWAYSEFLLKGRWLELWRLAAGRTGDPRSVLRRIVALGAMPLLPEPVQDRIRRLIHARDDTPDFANPLLKAAAQPPAGTKAFGGPGGIFRKARLAAIEARCGIAAEFGHGFEQVFGLRSRDVTHYRPLIEFCLSIPTDQFVRGGVSRWLARRMAVGRMPEAQRNERRYAMQNADLYHRLTAQVPKMQSQIAQMADDPDLAGLIDFDKARAMIDAWPEADPGYGRKAMEINYALPSTLLMAQFVRHVSGRN